MYNKKYMKYPLFSIIAAAFLAVYPVSAQEKAVTTAPSVESKKILKAEPLPVKKQKIEEGLSLTIQQLSLVIARTQTAIDLLTKNGKDTVSAQESLDASKEALKEAEITIALLSPNTETEKPAIAVLKTSTAPQKNTVTNYKDAVKKIQDILKDSRSSLIDSINALKESLISKEITPEE